MWDRRTRLLAWCSLALVVAVVCAVSVVPDVLASSTDIGGSVAQRESYDDGGENMTKLLYYNPAGWTGKIGEIRMWIAPDTWGDMFDLKVATFYENGSYSPRHFTCRDWESIDPAYLVPDSYQEVPVDLDVVEGDYLGFYCATYNNLDGFTPGGVTNYFYYEPGDMTTTSGEQIWHGSSSGDWTICIVGIKAEEEEPSPPTEEDEEDESRFPVQAIVAFIVLAVLMGIPAFLLDKVGISVGSEFIFLARFLFVLCAIMAVLFPYLARAI